jgi:hypothetical protein
MGQLRMDSVRAVEGVCGRVCALWARSQGLLLLLLVLPAHHVTTAFSSCVGFLTGRTYQAGSLCVLERCAGVCMCIASNTVQCEGHGFVYKSSGRLGGINHVHAHKHACFPGNALHHMV